METWTSLYNNDCYEVSNQGRVRSKNGVLKLSTDKGGYKLFTPCRDGSQSSMRVHQAVYYSFNGGRPSGFEKVIDHIDGDRGNNRLDNLRLVSQQENIKTGKSRWDNYSNPMMGIQDRGNDRYRVAMKIDGVAKRFGTHDLETAIELRDLILEIK